MNKVNKRKEMELKISLTITIIQCIAMLIIFAPTIKEKAYNLTFKTQKVNDSTNDVNIKKVEDIARDMIASYNLDKTKYEKYRDSVDEEIKIWREQSKVRANAIARNYNNYILKNSFVWGDNIPSHILSKLEYLN